MSDFLQIDILVIEDIDLIDIVLFHLFQLRILFFFLF
jgi:hypothetical protein